MIPMATYFLDLYFLKAHQKGDGQGKAMGKDTLVLFYSEHEAGPPSSDGGSSEMCMCMRTDEKRDIKIYSGLIPIFHDP